MVPLCARLVLVSVGLGLGVALFAPVIKSTWSGGHAAPKGQLRADWRTLCATARFLLQPTADNPPNVARFPDGLPMLAQGTNNRPMGFITGSSNQLWRCDKSSNSPA
jgi:hypothetical protein